MSAMTKARKAQLLTFAVLACSLAGVVWKRSGWRAPVAQPEPATPQGAIYAMLDAAREGDTGKYAAAWTGPMEPAIRQAVAEQTEAGFAEYLRKSNAAIKGVAITQPETLTDREVKVRVEYVYQDRNEVQFMYLEKAGESWKIARVDAAQRVPTLIPYGTPVE